MIGNRIAELRKTRGWNQRDLAKRLKLSPRAIMNWENAVSEPSAANILALAALFHVSTDYVLDYGDGIYISLEGLAEKDREILRAICQAYINVSEGQA